MGRKARTRRTKVKAQPQEEPLVNRFAAAHGDYRREAMPVTAGELGEAKHGQVQVLRNRGATTVERWKGTGSITQAQGDAIALYCRCWGLWMGQQRVTANWSETATFRGSTAAEFVEGKIEAKRMLDDMEAEIPHPYLDVFKNVVLFDEAAGVAGSRLGYRNKGAEASAKLVVLFISDIIAGRMRLS